MLQHSHEGGVSCGMTSPSQALLHIMYTCLRRDQTPLWGSLYRITIYRLPYAGWYIII